MTAQTYTVHKDKVNSSGVAFNSVETKTLADWNAHFGHKCKTIESLISIVNKEYAARYANSYRQSLRIYLAKNQTNCPSVMGL